MTSSSHRTDSSRPPQDTLAPPAATRRAVQDRQSFLLIVFLAGLLNASLFALATPLWQAPDEPGHFEYACLLGQLRRPLHGHDRSTPMQQAIIASLDRHDFWRLVREPQPELLPVSFAADPFLLRSARQVGDEPPIYYSAPAGFCLLPLPLETKARLIRLWGALLFGLTAAATAWAWTGGPQRRPSGAVVRLHPLVLAWLPMPAFIAGSINNDSLAMLSATLVFAAALRIQRLGWTWQRSLGLAALLVLALASKKTNLFLLPWLAGLAWAGLWSWLGRRGWSRRRRLAATIAPIVAATIVLLLPAPTPASWRTIGQLAAGRRVQTTLPDGPGWAARVTDGSVRHAVRLVNDMHQVAPWRGQQLTATVLVRSANREPAPGRLALRDTAGFSETTFVAGEQWQPVSVQHTLAITSTYLRLLVGPGWGLSAGETGQLLVAKAAVQSTAGLPGAAPLLHNGDFSARARLGALLGAPLENRWRQFAPRPLAQWEAPQRSLLYLALTFAGFWGNYGWLQAPLPIALYALLAMLTAAAGAGLLGRWRQDAALRPILAAWLLACLLIALQTFLPMIGRDWQPQGRYLFPALLPLTGLLLVGLDHWLRLDAYRARRIGLTLAVLALNLVGLAAAARVL
jgi:hypothetical protein